MSPALSELMKSMYPKPLFRPVSLFTACRMAAIYNERVKDEVNKTIPFLSLESWKSQQDAGGSHL